jgi:hypothetical protein
MIEQSPMRRYLNCEERLDSAYAKGGRLPRIALLEYGMKMLEQEAWDQRTTWYMNELNNALS